jgi:hypothetical protein
MVRELREKDRDVRGWIASYCSRNQIQSEITQVPVGRFYRESESYLQISFRSKNQLESFVTRGNWKFPCFEFR